MNKKKVIKWSNLPDRLPITSFAVLYLLLDKINVSQFVWGIFSVFTFMRVVIFIIRFITEKPVDFNELDK